MQNDNQLNLMKKKTKSPKNIANICLFVEYGFVLSLCLGVCLFVCL